MFNNLISKHESKKKFNLKKNIKNKFKSTQINSINLLSAI